MNSGLAANLLCPICVKSAAAPLHSFTPPLLNSILAHPPVSLSVTLHTPKCIASGTRSPPASSILITSLSPNISTRLLLLYPLAPFLAPIPLAHLLLGIPLTRPLPPPPFLPLPFLSRPSPILIFPSISITIPHLHKLPRLPFPPF